MNKLIVKTKIIDQSIVMRKLQYAKDSERGSGGYGSTGK